MARYIDADVLKEKLEKCKATTDDLFGMGICRGIERAETVIDMTPTADVAEVKHGEWIPYSTTMMECTVCKRHTPKHRYEFCPHCGARMDGEK